MESNKFHVCINHLRVVVYAINFWYVVYWIPPLKLTKSLHFVLCW